jgi:hypothetical protein
MAAHEQVLQEGLASGTSFLVQKLRSHQGVAFLESFPTASYEYTVTGAGGGPPPLDPIKMAGIGTQGKTRCIVERLFCYIFNGTNIPN